MPGERRLTSIKQLINDMLFRTSTTITNNPLETHITNNPLETHLTNIPLRVIREKTNLTITTTAVTVNLVDTLVLAANPNRKFLLLQRGNTAGRVYVKFSAGASTQSNSIVTRENMYIRMGEGDYLLTSEIRGISLGTTRIIYVTEGV